MVGASVPWSGGGLESLPRAAPNKALEPTAYSFGCAYASGGGSLLALGGPRGEWLAADSPHERGCGSVVGGARDPGRATVACGASPGALGAGARGPGGPPSPHPTSHWSGRATTDAFWQA